MLKKTGFVGTTALALGVLGMAACSQVPQEENQEVSSPSPTEVAPEPAETDSEPQGTPEEDPGVATDPDSAPAYVDVPIESFGAAYTYVDPFQVYVNEAYVDEDGFIHDGMGFSEQAPPGLEYHIFNVQITNDGTYPASFDTYGTVGYDAQGRQYTNNENAEWTVADDYFSGEMLNPGVSVETDIIFLLPEDVQLVEVKVQGFGSLIPMED